jgi:hypothetical protein
VGKNFALTMLRLHREKPVISVVADQVGCPTSTATLAPGPASAHGGPGISSTAKQLGHLWAVEQCQQSLELAAVGGGVKLEGKSASIKSISECIHSSNASSLLSCFERFSSSFYRISLSGSRRQLSVAPKWRAVLHEAIKNERKRDNDEPDAPLLLEREDAAGEADVVIGGNRATRPITMPARVSTAAGASNANRNTTLEIPHHNSQF